MGFARNLMAEAGGEIVTDTSPHSGRWQALVVLEDCEFESVGMPNFQNTEGLDGLSFYAGMVLYGLVTEFALKSGKVQAIRATT